MRLAVQFTTQPDTNGIRTLAMSMPVLTTGTPVAAIAS